MAEEVGQMIDGKLENQGCYASDVQVVIESSGALALHNKGWEFLVIPAEDTVSTSGDPPQTDPKEVGD